MAFMLCVVYSNNIKTNRVDYILINSTDNQQWLLIVFIIHKIQQQLYFYTPLFISL
jgi:hypothetical protein